MKTPKFFEFETVDELLNDVHFLTSLTANVLAFKTERMNRPMPEDKTKRWKRDWIDRMNDENQLTAEFFVQNIASVWAGTSKLSKEKREVMKYICLNAHNFAMNKYNEKFHEFHAKKATKKTMKNDKANDTTN